MTLLWLLCSVFLLSAFACAQRYQRSQPPNIIFMLTDDQDSELGSMQFMPHTRRILQDGGATFTNAFTVSPMCCPSRSSILTGLYVHNHNVYTNNQNCSSPQWQATHEQKNFGTYLSNAGYRTGYFGKYLNDYEGNHIPPGWSEWLGLIRNTRFYNYTVNLNGRKVRHGNDYHKDYLTDLITNDSLAFFRTSKQLFPGRPVAMVLSMPAPHGPEDSAPQYQHLFKNVLTHRTPSWNYAPNPDKQWILQYTGKMEQIHVNFTDMLHMKRLQTLQSVDEGVERLYRMLKETGELENTYFLYTSDHGYHLGQFGLIKGKAMPYEFDIRIPFFIRGPGIPSGISVSNIALNIDLAPTMIDMAGVDIPEHMDGRSLLKLFDRPVIINDVGQMRRRKAWRETFLVSRGKITKQKLMLRERLEAQRNNLLITKAARLEQECKRSKYQSPCSANQDWVCISTPSGRLRLQKCRPCSCGKGEQKRQQEFLLQHLSQPSRIAQQMRLTTAPARRAIRSLQRNLPSMPMLCRELLNQTVACTRSFFTSLEAWKRQKAKLDHLIHTFRIQLEQLKDARLKLHLHRPPTFNDSTACNCSESRLGPVGIIERHPFDAAKNTAAGNPLVALSRRHRRRQKKVERRAQNGRKSKEKCNSDRMKCFIHDDNHWKTDPKWTSERRRNGHVPNFDCDIAGLECALMHDDHWKVKPKWTFGPFCFCPNSNNNTYWCIRTINDTHNFLYCEFITGFLSYYDLNADPNQLHNSVFDLSFDTLQKLHKTLSHMKSCQGARRCTVRSRPSDAHSILPANAQRFEQMITNT